MASALFALGCGGDGTTQGRTAQLVPALGSWVPAPSSQQEVILFSSNRALDGSDGVNVQFTYNLWKVNLVSTDAEPLTKLTALEANSTSAAWSPDGKRIAFLSARAFDGSDASDGVDPPCLSGCLAVTNNIWVMNADGSGAVPMTTFTDLGQSVYGLVWSPDGTKIAFGWAVDGSGTDVNTINIWVMNADGSGRLAPLTNLSANRADSGNPVWSPDGTKIAFSSARALDGSDAGNLGSSLELTSNIWIASADGTGARPLTWLTGADATPGSNHADSYSPVWSPDGTRIAFSSRRALDGSDAPNTNSTANIWTMNSDGSEAQPLSALTGGEWTGGLAWSPDGTRIAFDSERALDGSDAGNWTSNIWVINANGTGATPLTRLTAADASSSNAVWSPDGAKIAYASRRAVDGSDAANAPLTDNIWIMNTDSTGATPVSTPIAPITGADSSYPQWLP